jgi:hypothetical protein
MLLRIGLVMALVVGAAVFAYQIGARLTDEAVMTVVGVLCGILASIPITIGLLLALTRDRSSEYPDEYDEVLEEPAPSTYPVYRPPAASALPPPPQIVVVAPPHSQLPPTYSPYSNYLLPAQTDPLPAPMHERNFKIVGEDEGE